MIIGGQSDYERRQEEDKFRSMGPRFLDVAAGGEGINVRSPIGWCPRYPSEPDD